MRRKGTGRRKDAKHCMLGARTTCFARKAERGPRLELGAQALSGRPVSSTASPGRARGLSRGTVSLEASAMTGAEGCMGLN